LVKMLPMGDVVCRYDECLDYLAMHADMLWKGDGYRGY
jgi:hypothetical protein